MIKRNYTILAFCLGLTAFSFAQTTGDQKAAQVQTIEQLETSNPKEHKAVLKYAEKHGSVIMDLPKGKEARLNGEISQEKADMVDPYKMGLSIPSANAYYRITGTEKMLMVKSLYTMQQEMKTIHR